MDSLRCTAPVICVLNLDSTLGYFSSLWKPYAHAMYACSAALGLLIKVVSDRMVPGLNFTTIDDIDQ